jgi:hypothetical protein
MYFCYCYRIQLPTTTICCLFQIALFLAVSSNAEFTIGIIGFIRATNLVGKQNWKKVEDTGIVYFVAVLVEHIVL